MELLLIVANEYKLLKITESVCAAVGGLSSERVERSKVTAVLSNGAIKKGGKKHWIPFVFLVTKKRRKKKHFCVE